MKILATLLLIIVGHFSLAAQNHLTFTILTNEIKDSTNIDILVSNNSSKNYYLLLDTLAIYSQNSTTAWKYLAYKNPLNISIRDKKDDWLINEIVDEDFENNYNEIKISELKNILKINSQEKIKFRFPFKFQYVLNQNTRFGTYPEFMTENKKYFVQINYNPPNDAFKEVLLLSQDAKDFLKAKNFKLYEKEINSNSIPLTKP